MFTALVHPLRASGLLFAVLACATAAQASSFDCAKAASASERAICADPYTAGLDSRLGKAWTATLAEAKDPKALRLGQREWLKQRDQCQADLGCLRSQYLSRLMVLRYVNIPFNWQGTWQRVSVSPFYGGELVIRRSGEARLSFDLSAMGGAHSGVLAGKLQLKGGEARYDVKGCKLRLTPRNGLLQVTQEGDAFACGAGLGVYYDGLYVASRQILESQYDLLSTALVRTEEEDQRARKLLQQDYQTLLDSGSVFSQDTSAELKGAEVTEMWLRGLANTHAAIFVRGAKGELWVALLALVGPQDEVRVRYYTTEPEWKLRLPDVVQSWYEARGQGTQLPLDMMP